MGNEQQVLGFLTQMSPFLFIALLVFFGCAKSFLAGLQNLAMVGGLIIGMVLLTHLSYLIP